MPRKLTKKEDIKIFILYLMDRMGYPLEYDTITSIIIQDDIVNYFDFAQCFVELEDMGHIEKLEVDGDNPKSRYRVTKTGKAVADGLNSVIAKTVKDKGFRSALRHMSLAKRGAVVDQTIKLDGEGVLFSGSIKDKAGLQLEVSLRTDNEHQLKQIQSVFADRPEVILRGITALLTGDLDFVFGPAEDDR
ncbi:MAG: DUF4364 family protein [Clostridia bacterium]|nr:DUF4364 family protein [Clostridia bacterium]